MRNRLLCFCLLIATLAACARPALANNDIVQFGSDIRVGHDMRVHDTVCFFCNVDAQGIVEGDVVVFFGNVHIAQRASKDVVNFFGKIKADDGASIGQDMVSMFGSVHLGENVSIGKDAVAMFGSMHAASNINVGGDRVVQPAWLFWGPLFALGLIVYVIIHEIRASRRRSYLRGYPYPPNVPRP